jgi:hypothetical protein
MNSKYLLTILIVSVVFLIITTSVSSIRNPTEMRYLESIMEEAPPDYQIRLALGVPDGSGENELQQLRDAGMNVTSDFVNCAGIGRCVLGRANASVIEKILTFNWIEEIMVNEPTAHEPEYEPPKPWLENKNLNGSGILMSASILSNSVDMPSAMKIKTFLENSNIAVHDIFPASTFGNLPTASYLFILGGPEAYESIGEVSAEYLTESEESYLTNTTNASRYWIKEKYRVVVIAGHTRNETALAEKEFEEKGFEEFLEIWRK